jgi:hypothetical protein
MFGYKLNLFSKETENDKRMKEHEKLKKAATPLLKYLNNNWHPHVTAIVTPTSIEVMSGELSQPKIFDFVRD